MRRGWLVVLLVVTGVLGGCQTDRAASPPSSTALAGRHQPPPIRFSGNKTTKTGPFLVAGGLTVFTAEHRGRGSFAVEVLTHKGELNQLVFLTTGRYRGSTGLGLGGGIYRLRISASTPWKVEITQPRGRSGAALPQHYRGVSDALVGPFRVDRSVRVDLQHNGPGAVTLELLSDQEPLYFLLTGSGRFKGSQTATNLETGAYYLNVDVEADSAWTLALYPG
jgi:hypothetical protein